jgi:hypothetical protein
VAPLRAPSRCVDAQPDEVSYLNMKDCAMKWTTVLILGIGCVIAWPITKDATIDKIVNTYAQQAQLKENDLGGPIGSAIAIGFMKSVASGFLNQQEIGTQIEVVFEVLVIGQIPPLPSM